MSREPVDLLAEGARIARESRAIQGLPERITDPAVLDDIAAIHLASASASSGAQRASAVPAVSDGAHGGTGSPATPVVAPPSPSSGRAATTPARQSDKRTAHSQTPAKRAVGGH